MKFTDRLWKNIIIGICFSIIHYFISLLFWGNLFARHMSSQGITSFNTEQLIAWIFWFPIGLLAGGNPTAITINSIVLGAILVARRREDRECIKSFFRNILPKNRKSWIIFSTLIILAASVLVFLSEYTHSHDEVFLNNSLYSGSAHDFKKVLKNRYPRDTLTHYFLRGTWEYCTYRSSYPDTALMRQKLELLLKYGANVNANTDPKSPVRTAEDPPILRAADICDIELIKMLLEHNADLYLAGESGRRAIDVLSALRGKDNRLEAIWPLIQEKSQKRL